MRNNLLKANPLKVESFSARQFTIAALSIILIAFFLRIWGIWNVTTTDEYNEVFEALRICSGHLNFERWFKRVFLYILAIEYGIFYAIGWVLNIYSDPMDFATQIVRNLDPLFLIGRFTSVLAGTITVSLLIKIGARFFNRMTALIAAILLTLTIFHVDLSQQVKVDAILGMFIALSLYFLLKIALQEPTRWDFILTGFFMALAIQTKINAIVLGVPFLIAFHHEFRRTGFKPILKSFEFFIIGFFIGFIVGNPAVIFAPINFLKAFLGLGRVYTQPINAVPNDLIGFIAYPVYYYRAVGPIISFFTVCALIHSVLKPNRARVVLLSFLFPFYCLMGASRNLVADYYFIPGVIVLYLMIGSFLSDLWSYSCTINNLRHQKMLASVFVILFFSSLSFPLVSIYRHELSLFGKNTRSLAKQWIETNIPSGSKLLMDSGKSINSFAPPIAENSESLNRIVSRSMNNIEANRIVHGMVDKNAVVYYELLKKTIPPISYDITSTMFGLDLHPIEYYRNNGYQYFIISYNMLKHRANEYMKKTNPIVHNFYNSLLTNSHLSLIQVIKPSKYNRGDTFLVFKIVEK